MEERERLVWERARKLQTRVNARHNMAWMRKPEWTGEQFEELLLMLGLDDIDVEGTTPVRITAWEPGSDEEGTGEDGEADANT